MSRPCKVTVPKYLLHKPTGQAYARVRTEGGGYRFVYLGKFNSPESKAEYERLLAELRVAPVPAAAGRASALTVSEALLAFARHAEGHYAGGQGEKTRELTEYRQTLRLLRELYGHTPAAEFGPLALKAVRGRMVDAGLCRSLVNQRVGRVKRIFKWLASEELVPAAVFHALTTVSGLVRGKTTAPDREPVAPVADDAVLATLPFVTPTVAGMIELQRLTGMRPGEVGRISPAEIDTTADVWVYRPARHKGDWRGKPRAVAIGPKGQAVLATFTPAAPSGFYFSPRRAVAEFHAIRAAGRRTPKFASHMKRNAGKRKGVKSKRPPGEFYTTTAYGQAIAKGVRKANAAAAKHDVPAGHHGPNLPRVPHWHPNQLRHTHGTEVRRRFGLEAAQVALGHSRADVTQVYAERDASLAEKIASEIG